MIYPYQKSIINILEGKVIVQPSYRAGKRELMNEFIQQRRIKLMKGIVIEFQNRSAEAYENAQRCLKDIDFFPAYCSQAFINSAIIEQQYAADYAAMARSVMTDLLDYQARR